MSLPVKNLLDFRQNSIICTQDKNDILVFDGVLTEEYCQNLITKFLSSNMVKPGLTMSGLNPAKISLDTFMDKDPAFNGEDFKYVTGKAFELLSILGKKYPNLMNWTGDMTYPGIRCYPKNEGKFDWHCDTSCKEAHGGYRQLAMLWYLNTVTSGGETEFYHQDQSIKPITGRVCVFPSSWTHLHRGCISVESKYLMNMFITTPISDLIKD